MKKKSKSTPAQAAELSLLGAGQTVYPTRPEEAILESFPNRHPDRDYIITLDCPEFTALCPITQQPDFGHLEIEYIPDQRCVESKSLKLYLFSYRNHGAFHEEVVNLILDDLVACTAPRSMTIRGHFRPRGGIAIHVEATYQARIPSTRRRKGSLPRKGRPKTS